MGEAAEAILDGDCCQVCGEWFHDDESPGHPRTCAGCGGEDYSPPPGSGKRRRAKRRRQRLAKRKREALAKANPAGWQQHTPYHWSRMHAGKELHYWPSTGKFQYNGVVQKGDPIDFMKGTENGNHTH